jgi:hypothetical protein
VELGAVVLSLQALLAVPGHDANDAAALEAHCELFKAAAAAQAETLDALETAAKRAEANCQAELTTLSVRRRARGLIFIGNRRLWNGTKIRGLS